MCNADLNTIQMAGMVGKIFEFPFDTVKVRLQSQPEMQPLRYHGPLDCLKQSLRQGGIRGMYHGISPPLVGAAAENSSLFFSYNVAQNLLRQSTTIYSSSESLPLNALIFCGAASGAFTSLILTPIELIKCKMQVQTMNPEFLNLKPPGPLALIRDIHRTYGLRGLWHGQMGTFLRETGGSAAWFGSYEYVSGALQRWRGTSSSSASDHMLAGAAAGVSYNFILFPADSVKSRIQTSAIGVPGEGTPSFYAVGRKMYMAGGIRALYRGCGITCLRSAPSSALIFLCYETMRKWFQ
ncbi:mitochondrial carrier domain-containing protein [Geopyxis carbonaria]|nr:mitochondrial carrier domain-containing protein [Geopyxis carbonaria]